MRKRPDPPSISNLALGGVAALFVVTLGVLGGLYYSLRAGRAAALAKSAPSAQLASVENSALKTPIENSPPTVQVENDAPVIRVALKSGDATPIVEPQQKLVAQTAAAPERESVKTEELANSATPLPAVAKESSNELVPDVTGLSYTAKKALSNGGDASSMVKPGDNRPGKKPDAKKPIPAVPVVPPKTPVKPEPPKAAQPKTEPAKPPGLPAIDPLKIDISKAPVYVLNDGRRIRALAVRENGTNITVKNEVGMDITFKKSDVKEIVRG